MVLRVSRVGSVWVLSTPFTFQVPDSVLGVRRPSAQDQVLSKRTWCDGGEWHVRGKSYNYGNSIGPPQLLKKKKKPVFLLNERFLKFDSSSTDEEFYLSFLKIVLYHLCWTVLGQRRQRIETYGLRTTKGTGGCSLNTNPNVRGWERTFSGVSVTTQTFFPFCKTGGP